MQSWRQTIHPPSDGRAFEIKKPAAALRVMRGGWPGLRLTFDNDVDPALNANSFELWDGAVIVNEYQRAYVRWPADAPPFPLELEFYSCADLALEPAAFEAPPMRYTVLSRASNVTLTEPINPVTLMTPRSTIEDGRGDRFLVTIPPGFASAPVVNPDVRPFFAHAVWLDGFASADAAYTIAVYAQIDRAGTRKSLIGTQAITAVNAFTGRFDASLSAGLLRPWVGGVPFGPVPMPIFGAVIELRLTVAAATNFDWMFWTRSQ